MNCTNLLRKRSPFFPSYHHWNTDSGVKSEFWGKRDTQCLIMYMYYRVQAFSMRTDIYNQVQETNQSCCSIERQCDWMADDTPIFSTQSDLPWSDELQTALGYFRSRTVQFTLGQHLPFSPHCLSPLLFTFPETSHHSNTSWVCIPRLSEILTENRNDFHI